MGWINPMEMDNETKIESSKQATPGEFGNPASNLNQEYFHWQAVFDVQPDLIQRFLESQARILGDALIQSLSQIRFTFPDSVVVNLPSPGETPILDQVPLEQREQLIGGLMERLARTNIGTSFRQRLDELEASSLEAVSICSSLIRFATATDMVHDRLPSGRSVVYLTDGDEDIPTIPADEREEIPSAITAATDAIVEEDTQDQEITRGELLVPYVPAARRFFLPQWVAFDEHDRLLVSSVNEAESYIVSMQHYLKILHAAVSLAPYMVADEQYQIKRYGILGQLVNQGRCLARFETDEIIATIRRRAAANDLNRGLSLSLPYFDDQILEMKSHEMDVIPAGRIVFIPGFVVLAARKEQAKVNQDTRLSRSTRKHLLNELQLLEFTFDQSSE
jgi:hypothetical protein